MISFYIDYCSSQKSNVLHNKQIFKLNLGGLEYAIDDGVGEKYTSERDFSESTFTPEELKILQTVKSELQNISTQNIIELSHKKKHGMKTRIINRNRLIVCKLPF